MRTKVLLLGKSLCSSCIHPIFFLNSITWDGHTSFRSLDSLSLAFQKGSWFDKLLYFQAVLSIEAMFINSLNKSSLMATVIMVGYPFLGGSIIFKLVFNQV